MNLQLIRAGLTKAVVPACNSLRAKAPQIFVAVGITTGIGCVITACKATLAVDDIIDYVGEKKEKMINRVNDVNDDYSEELQTSDTVKLYIQTGVELGKLYIPSVILGIVSVSCFLGSNRILSNRNTVLVGLVSSLEHSFSKYRDRVVSEYGEKKDFQFKNGIYEEEVTVEYVDENGKKKKKKETFTIINTDDYGMYTRIFDCGNKGWSQNPERNLMFLRSVEKFANQRLHAYGYVFLSEVLDDLGFPETESSRVCGWTLGPDGDGRVDFGIYELLNSSEAARNFVNGYEANVLLNFNCEGYIADKIPGVKPNIWVAQR